MDRMVFEGPDRRRPVFPAAVPAVLGDLRRHHEGEDRDEYLREMCTEMPEHVEGVFGLCAGAPRPLRGNAARFSAWIAATRPHRRRSTPTGRRLGAEDVRSALALQKRVREFALRNPYERPEVLQANFEAAFGA